MLTYLVITLINQQIDRINRQIFHGFLIKPELYHQKHWEENRGTGSLILNANNLITSHLTPKTFDP